MFSRLNIKKNSRFVGRFLRRMVLEVQRNAAQEQMIRGGGGPPHPSRLTSRTGTGRRSISVNLAPLPLAAEVGSDLAYMALHETGGLVSVPSTQVQSHIRKVVFGRTVAPFTVPAFTRGAFTYRARKRPWLAPAVDAVLRRAPDIAVSLWERELESAR